MKKIFHLVILSTVLSFHCINTQTTKLGYRGENPIKTSQPFTLEKAKQIYKEAQKANPLEYSKRAAEQIKSIMNQIKKAKTVAEKENLARKASEEAFKATIVSSFPIEIPFDSKKFDQYYAEALKVIFQDKNALEYAREHAAKAEKNSLKVKQASNKKEKERWVQEALKDAFKVMVINGLLRKIIEDSGFKTDIDTYLSLRDEHLEARDLDQRARVVAQVVTQDLFGNKEEYKKLRKERLDIQAEAESAREMAKKIQQEVIKY